jgi:7,8-dihydropterin-6-yl-methyl-4-(beta-D-ribofuranosyl)aminobenzene 5'-phosphate synthase
MPITILFDNHNPQGGERSLWGFAAYVHEHRLLFDTGSNGRALLHNMERLGIDIREVDYLFLSHDHWDHIGGVDSVLEANPDLTLFLPDSLSKNMIADLRTQSREVIVCDNHPRQLTPTLYSTGMQGKKSPEHALVIDGEAPTLLTGCGHHGIDRILKQANTLITKPIQNVLGGFHLLDANEAVVDQKITALIQYGVTHVLPTHCTGSKAIEQFDKAFGDGCFQGGVGAMVNF